MKNRRHLRRLGRITISHIPIYFVTISSLDRQPVLTHHDFAFEIMDAMKKCEQFHGWAVGRFVIMPDHLHFFCCYVSGDKTLSDFVRDLKRWLSDRARRLGVSDGRVFQNEFFDHLLRDDESYALKWDYVSENPVRAGLCENSKDWPFQGECVRIDL